MKEECAVEKEKYDRLKKSLEHTEAKDGAQGGATAAGASSAEVDKWRLKCADLEARIADAEQELDEQAGTIQQLEQVYTEIIFRNFGVT